MALLRLLLLASLAATVACAHGIAWQHRSLRSSAVRKAVWPLGKMDVPDFNAFRQCISSSAIPFVIPPCPALCRQHLQQRRQQQRRQQGALDDVAPHIVGGQNASLHQFPHQVSMQVTGSPYGTQHICGGSLVASTWVLTAAHCAWGVPEFTTVFVLAGKTDLFAVEEGEVRSDVADMYTHRGYRPGWNHGVGPNDIALLRLVTPIEVSPTIRYARLPAAGDIPKGSGILSGWGSVSRSTDLVIPTRLQMVELAINDFETCKAFISSLDPDEINPLRDTNLCTGSLTDAGVSSCQGDSGGPFVTLRGEEATVIGVVSWGYTPCGRVPAPSVFTRVSAFVGWVRDVMDEHGGSSSSSSASAINV